MLLRNNGVPTTLHDFAMKALNLGSLVTQTWLFAHSPDDVVKQKKRNYRDEHMDRAKKVKYDPLVSASVTTADGSINLCKGCGRGHIGKCSYSSHPDFNKSDKPWAESEQGKYMQLEDFCIHNLFYNITITHNFYNLQQLE